MRQDQRQLVECGGCGLTLLWPLPSLAELSEYYGAIYFGFGKADQLGKGYAYAQRLKAIAPRGKLLDVGCATGFFIEGVHRSCDWQVSGVDYGASAVRYAKKTLGLDVRQGTLAQAGFKAGSFDVIHLNNVLEHELDPLALLKACAKVLKPGGLIWMAVPNGGVDRARYKDYLQGWGQTAESQDGHTFFYSGRSLDLLVAKAGLTSKGSWSAGMLRGARALGWLPRQRNWHLGFAPRDRGPKGAKPSKRRIEDAITMGRSYPKAYYIYKDLKDRATRIPGYWNAAYDYHLLLTR